MRPSALLLSSNVPSDSAKRARARFSEIVSLDDQDIDLAEAVLIIAAEEYPHLDIQEYINKLDQFGDLARARAASAHDPYDVMAALNSTLFETAGFHGCRDSYYDPRNSFLNQVIDRRTGVPITLTVVYMEVARRIGFTVEGVGLAHHFIAKVETDEGEVFIDPFNEGRLLNVEGCAKLIDEITEGRDQLDSRQLAAVSKEVILGRILLNLLGLYKASDPRRAIAAVERLLLIVPDHAPYVQLQGRLLANMGEQASAITALERYLSLAPDAEDADEVRQQIKTIRLSKVRLN